MRLADSGLQEARSLRRAWHRNPQVRLKEGRCDYLLLIDRKPVGIIEAKKTGVTLSTVADQSGRYAENLPDFLRGDLVGKLPFLYESTGIETYFRGERDPHPRSRRVFAFHRPETLAQWLEEPDTLRHRLAEMPFKATALIVDLSPIYEYLEKRGGAREREYIVYADTPIQFLLPEPNSLTSEALAAAVEKDVDGSAVHVFTAEHLAAIALQANRGKDKTRLVEFIEEGALNMDQFKQILERHDLVPRWEQFERTILSRDQ
ncbi:hypothetical protein BH20VER1_BH20VER1_00410 [soil metagenome]